MTDETNPLYLRDPKKACPVCGTWLSTNHPGEPLRPCPLGPHDPSEHPRKDPSL